MSHAAFVLQARPPPRVNGASIAFGRDYYNPDLRCTMRYAKLIGAVCVCVTALAAGVGVARASITEWDYAVGHAIYPPDATWAVAQVVTSEVIQDLSSWIYYETSNGYTYQIANAVGGVGWYAYNMRSDDLIGGCVDMAASISVKQSGNWENRTQDGCP